MCGLCKNCRAETGCLCLYLVNVMRTESGGNPVLGGLRFSVKSECRFYLEGNGKPFPKPLDF